MAEQNGKDTKEQTFEAFVEKERTRLGKRREELLAKQTELQQQLDNIDRELAAITAYADVKAGKVPASSSAPRKPRAPSTGRKGSKREAVLEIIRANPSGIAPKTIIEQLGADDHTVHNALNALKKQNLVVSENRMYKAV